MKEDVLLKEFFSMERWKYAISKGVELHRVHSHNRLMAIRCETCRYFLTTMFNQLKF